MEAVFSQQRLAPALGAFAAGIAVFWLAKTPFGLLAPVAALFFLARGRAVLLLHAALAIGLAGSLLAAAFYAGAAHDLAVTWAAFFAVALSIGAIVATGTSASPSAKVMPAAIQSTTREQAPSYPVIGPTLEEKAAPRHSPFVSISAQDDKTSAAQLGAASFWGGTSFHMSYWRRLPDGSHRWTEVRTEPLQQPGGTQRWSGVSAEIDDPKPTPEQPTKTAFNPPNDDDAVRAAKFVENLLGNAWAFDAAGRPTYLTPLAQTFVAVTLEEFQAAVDEGHTFFKRTAHPDDYDRISAAWRHSLQTGDPFFLDRRIRRASGIHEWNRTGMVPTRDRQGRVTGWYGSTIDLDSYRIAEAELREREWELRQLVNMVPSHLWRLTPDGEPIFFSKRMVDFLGQDVADMDQPGMSRLGALIETIHPDDAADFRDTLRRCLVTGESFAMRYRLRRADGVYRWMSSRAEPMRDEDGRIVQWYGLCQDIDDQVHAEEALRQSERKLQQMIDALPVRVWSATSMGGPIYFNKRYQDYLRSVIPDFEALGEPGIEKFMQELIHPEDAPGVRRAMQGCFETGNGAVMRFRWRETEETYRWSECRVEPRRDQDGAVVQWYGASVDIDDEVRAQEALRARERALRQSERQLQQMIDAVPATIWSTTREGTPTYVNKRFTDVIGATVEDITAPDGSPALGAIIHPDDLDETVARVRESFRTGIPYVMQYRQVRRGGSYRWTETRAEALRDESGEILQWYGVSVDIHDMVTAQEALRDRERELSQLVNMVPVHIRRLTPQGEPTFFNKRLMDFFGLGDVADLDKPGMSRLAAIIQTLVYPDDTARLLETARRSFASGEPFSMKYRMRRADGAYRWVDTRAEPLRNQSGTIVQWYVISLDIDDEMRAQEASRRSERELLQLVNLVPVYIRRLTPDGEPTFFNKRLTDFIGVDLTEIGAPGASRLAPAIEDFVHPDEAGKLLVAVRRALATGEGYAMKYRMRRADGVYRWIETRSEPVRNQDGTIAQWYVVSIDVDDEVRAQQAEESLRQASDKLAKATHAAGLAELSASIAHEVNQPLAAVVANSHACQRWLKSEPPNLERAQITVERIIRDANSAADVVSRIRALFRQSVEPRNNTTLTGAIAEACNLMAEEAARHRVRMEINAESNLPLVAFDRVQIQQVLTNLIRNGIDAMESTADDRVLGIRVLQIGNVVQTEISDRGPGVEFADKIFEPFFTTKEHGMGMGLAICRSVVESHGGRLWAEKNEPHGATFVFTLPAEVKTTP